MLSATGGANAAHSRQEKLDDAGDEEVTNSCLILFTPYDKLAIERVVGQKRCDHIFQSKKSTFMFC